MPQQAVLDKNYDFFLETDLDKYKGEWVIICNNEIISHGNNLKEIVEEAKKKCGSKKFLITRVPSEETMIF
jgi:2-polyprenyl-3-methyl-5-hydroxy-6-metoxy-1,4-benzoquinol methylase